MDSLAALAKELGYPSANKLYDAATREGLRLTHRQIQGFIASQSVRQVFRKLPPSKGKIAAPNVDEVWIADLVDYSWRPSESKEKSKEPPFQYILVVQDVFSRRLMGTPLRDKLADTCQKAFQRIVEDRNVKPKVLATDLGWEFKGAFDDYLEREGIHHRLKDTRALNSQGTLDAAIRGLRPILARIQVEEQTKDWAGRQKSNEPSRSTTVSFTHISTDALRTTLKTTATCAFISRSKPHKTWCTLPTSSHVETPK